MLKPVLGRYSEGVAAGALATAAEHRRLRDAPVLYQERLEVGRARVPAATGRGWKRESRHLILGVLLTGSAVAGLYTRGRQDHRPRGGVRSRRGPREDLIRQRDEILRGARPGGIPIEQPTRFELIMSVKTARR